MDDNDGDDHTVDTEDTSHDDRDDWFHDELGFEDTHGADAHTGFGATVGGAEVGEDECWGDTDVSKEIVVWVFSHICLLLW